MEEKKVKGRLGNLVPFILLCIFAVIYIFPILIMLSSSFRTNDQIFDTSLGLWPESFNLDNFTEVFDVMPFWKYFWNTMWVTGIPFQDPLEGQRPVFQHHHGQHDDPVHGYHDSPLQTLVQSGICRYFLAPDHSCIFWISLLYRDPSSVYAYNSGRADRSWRN